MIVFVARILRYVSAIFEVLRRVNSSDRERSARIFKQAPLACVQPVCAFPVLGRSTWARRTEYGIDRMAIRIGGLQPVIVVLLAVFISLGLQLVQPESVLFRTKQWTQI